MSHNQSNKSNNHASYPTLPCAAAQLVPQHPPMRLVETLLSKEKDSGFVEAITPESGPFVHPEYGLLPEYLIEVVAQAVAASNGFDLLRKGDSITNGFLVGVNRFAFFSLPTCGEVLTISFERTLKFEAMSIFKAWVRGQVHLYAEGEVKTWQESGS